MQISNMLGHYNQAVSAGAEKVTGTKGVEKLVSSLDSLTKGNIFEGTVSAAKNGRVTLALSNGTQITARMDAKIALTEGQSMFFQVKSNDGATIAIRPFVVDGNGVNYTLMQALAAAGLPTQANYLSMVNKMMEEQMPIDKASLQQMARLVNSNGSIDVQTLVQMSKLGIELTPENAAQFENYLGDKQAITSAIDSLIDELPMAMQADGLTEEGLRQMDAKVLSVITEGLEPTEPEPAGELTQAPGAAAEPAAAESLGQGVSIGAAPAANPLIAAASAAAEGIALVLPLPEAGEELSQGEQAAGETAADRPAEAVEGNAAEEQTETADEIAAQEQDAGETKAAEGQTAAGEQTQALGNREKAAGGESQMPLPGRTETVGTQAAAPAGTPSYAGHSLGTVLDERQLETLNDMLKGLVNNAVRYDGSHSTAGFLNDIKELLESKYPIDRDGLQRLLASGEFKALVKNTLEQQWTVKPQELTGSDKINKLYEKLDAQMNRIGNVLKATGQESAAFHQTAADIRSNVEFMNQINQAYTYVQIPLKMSGQTASGELYVYTNKKALAEGNRELTAFLHLDMDHLGPTDVSVKLFNKEVSTNFYLENDAAYQLLEANLPILEERLKAKGYNCKLSVVNEAKHVNFVEDFLKKDQPSAGKLHRYSFDMRA